MKRNPGGMGDSMKDFVRDRGWGRGVVYYGVIPFIFFGFDMCGAMWCVEEREEGSVDFVHNGRSRRVTGWSSCCIARCAVFME
jgi:hypothetical protein